jgi:hypothetical protein
VRHELASRRPAERTRGGERVARRAHPRRRRRRRGLHFIPRDLVFDDDALQIAIHDRHRRKVSTGQVARRTT